MGHFYEEALSLLRTKLLPSGSVNIHSTALWTDHTEVQLTSGSPQKGTAHTREVQLQLDSIVTESERTQVLKFKGRSISRN